MSDGGYQGETTAGMFHRSKSQITPQARDTLRFAHRLRGLKVYPVLLKRLAVESRRSRVARWVMQQGLEGKAGKWSYPAAASEQALLGEGVFSAAFDE